MLSFGDRLRCARERAGLTQLDVYRAIGLNNKSLSRYEHDATAPDPDTIQLLVRLYDVSTDYVLGLSDVMGCAFPHSGTSLAAPKASEEAAMLEKIAALSPAAKEKAADYVEMLKTLDEVKSGADFLDLKKSG